ncbi:putative proline-rich receptor-like protein kinase PERK8 [Capsicum annuum]|uniref:Protein GAMETE EXPRESSED 3 n=1 Tax=Capsicum annuum TaxID=4072 RepID=A0A2G2ZNH5_CAPAN|nr:putative proline-rich receptor-like protein kinase PERK8 [Capsicum annuum]KAF3661218.1 putative proline-rich receptor-like protein kinase PERK8 [Capsicum annuum]PHT83539.1 hypothetical protein T459_11982 [Capsicum annuum]
MMGRFMCAQKRTFLPLKAMVLSRGRVLLVTNAVQIYVVAEDRVLKINPLNVGSSGIAVELFFGTESERPGEIIGLAISNNEGEIYALSTHSPHFKWIQDFSSFGSTLTMTTGNNGVLYVTVAAKALVLAVDVSRGIILWLKSFGPLSTGDYAPAVDSNGWISIGSLDGYLYSFSPKGVLKKFPKVLNMDSVIQVSPVLDCSGYAIYVSQTQIEGKSTRIIGDYTYISGMKPEGVIFTLINPVTGTIFWSEKYPGQFSSEFLRNDLQHFLLDESVLLGFFAASSHKFALSCSQITFKNFNAASLCMLPHEFLIYYMKYLHSTLCYVLESFILLLSTNCLVFDLGFSGAQLQSKDISAILHVGAPLGSRTSLRQFANVRRLLRLQKKSFDKSITELQRKVAEEAIANEVLEKLGNLVKEREGIHRKLSTSYSLGRDEVGSHSASLLPLSDRKTRSFSFQGAKKESVTLFHTVSGTSSETSWSGRDSDTSISEDEEETYKGKSPIEISSCSDDEIYHEEYQSSNPSFFASSSKYAEEIEEMKPGDQKDPLIFPYRTAIQA